MSTVQKRNSITGERINYEGIRKSLSLDRDVEKEYKFEEEGMIILDNGPSFGKRHVEAILFFLAVLISFCMRIQLSLTIVAMTNSNTNENMDIPTFNWTNRNVILSSFFWGYVIPQVVAGWLMTRYGPKWFLVGTIAMGSITEFMIPPLAVTWGSTAVIVCRIIQGLCQGFMIPAVACFMSRWVPASERGRIGTFIFAAGSIGTVFGMMISGTISASPYGWPMVFHFFGVLGLLWCVVYSICGYNSPSEHTSITDEERVYIERTAAVSARRKAVRTPWREILSSVPFLALFYASTCYVLGFWLLLTQIPTYMNKIMSFNITSNGLITASQFITQWILGLVFSVISDQLTNKNIISVSTARKTCTALGMICPAISLLMLGQCTKDDTARGVILLVIAVGSCGANLCGTFINNVDLSPNFAGVMQGIVNGFSNISGIVAPLIVQVMVTDEENPEHWRRVFYLASVAYASGAFVFWIFGSGDVQPWNDDKKDEDAEVM